MASGRSSSSIGHPAGPFCIASFFLWTLDDQVPPALIAITNKDPTPTNSSNLPPQMREYTSFVSLEIGPAPAQNRDRGLALSLLVFLIPFSCPPFIPGFYVPPTGIHRGHCPPIADAS
ncbi:uncharacterized protein MCYG_06284 [Microsporum canis CBS 113480]|uniref:Uncharacterized protein n=1 Tax=Arthroderma otae (strain ATCC MYA-4605 / CBS 113480) TaxID=554155 RepID=C5FU81_ARTOC|nr:uncharacterized protein MCYG_06284 [Microsporum canis CBS 113480]EEQ33465.1 predicted protein [Microsporum canis CBS 113480]